MSFDLVHRYHDKGLSGSDAISRIHQMATAHGVAVPGEIVLLVPTSAEEAAHYHALVMFHWSLVFGGFWLLWCLEELRSFYCRCCNDEGKEAGEAGDQEAQRLQGDDRLERGEVDHDEHKENARVALERELKEKERAVVEKERELAAARERMREIELIIGVSVRPAEASRAAHVTQREPQAGEGEQEGVNARMSGRHEEVMEPGGLV